MTPSILAPTLSLNQHKINTKTELHSLIGRVVHSVTTRMRPAVCLGVAALVAPLVVPSSPDPIVLPTVASSRLRTRWSADPYGPPYVAHEWANYPFKYPTREWALGEGEEPPEQFKGKIALVADSHMGVKQELYMRLEVLGIKVLDMSPKTDEEVSSFR